MDPIKALDMEHRSGISQQEVEDFANRMDLISKAMKDIKDGTFDPLKCNIPGYKTPEQEELERKERVKREEERRKREEERKQKEKQEEHDNWWHKAELCYSMRDADKDEEKENKINKSEQWANRIVAAYKTRDANDYSLWNQWVPEDPVSLQEKAEREAELEKLRNREFENNNPEFCNQFKKDMEERQRSQEEKARTADRLKQKGNRLYKKKQYQDAIRSYMEALTAAPFNVAVLANIAQCYLRLDQLDDCIEFCTRTLYVDENYVKALSRRATAWHRQKKLKEAADDMRKALALDTEDVDIVEQHSIIVGDFEDSITNNELEAALNKRGKMKNGSLPSVSLGPSSIDELRFSLEIFKKMDEQTTADNSSTRVQDAWVAYDLVLPFMERNEHVRAKFRTSGAMDKLCGRILSAFNLPEGDEVDKSRQQAENLILSGMINCAAAAVADTPRNQVVMFRNVEFRKQILTFFGDLKPSSSWTIQSSVVRFLEQVVDSKSWRNAIIAADEVISSLLAALCFSNNLPSDERKSMKMATSSICFTLSSDTSGIQAFSSHGVECLAAITKALEMNSSTDLLRNVLGFLTNLSTDKILRKTFESDNCKATRRNLVRVLLQIAQNGEPKDFTGSERALGTLLNLSFTENSQARHDLLDFGAVETVERILSQANPSSFNDSILVLSRTASLLCRLHSVCRTQDEVFDRLTSPGLLSELCTVCELASSSFGKKMATIPTELWQLCSQIWCHLGWCAHLPSVRAFLREKNAVSLLIQVIKLANSQNGYIRPSGETTACERLVGNIVKVLIAMQSDNDSGDSQVFRKKESLVVVVKALEELSDGLARKNVAILLAKLCQSDSHVKDTVRDLRGIEMMLSVSQSLKQRPTVLSCSALKS
ncbi:hypothetical protein F442_04900 [Phytophthora nicotianae P10297]|uniref:Uncharacterized protein n=2 Tax=Phytophthora nicotianae P10297 TaxID=1317064 RepID=W2ZTR4_PHYNI|nr:hypothetical protein F442_04900 [Phytophthora nicotianae P10297]